MSFSTKEQFQKCVDGDIGEVIKVKFRNEKSISGYSWDVVKSGLQKYIRRNNVDMALKMAFEMYCFDYLEGGQRILTNGLHRLQVIFLEDIGCGNLNLWPRLCEWFSIIYKERQKKERNRFLEIETLKKIVVNMCLSRKIRGCSFMNVLCSIGDYRKMVKNCVYTEFTLDDIKDIDKDKNKVLLKCLDEFLAVKSWKSIIVLREVLKQINSLKGGAKKTMNGELAQILEKYFRFLKCSKQWEKDIGHLKEGYLLYFAQLCDYLYGCDELQLVEKCGDGTWDATNIGYVELDDFVYDRHVKKSKNTSTSYFATTSSLVMPKTTKVAIPYEFEEIYKWNKGEKKEELIFEKKETNTKNEKNEKKQKKVKKVFWNFPERESELDFVCRAQLVTSYAKTDTYFAKGVDFNKEQLWLVKGPYFERNEIDEFIDFQAKKKTLNLPYITCFVVKMKVDRWPERPGIGLRHKFGVDDDGYFMFSKSVVKECDLKIITHPGSKKWGATDVVDLKKFSVDVFELNDEQMVCYLNNIGFRLKYNIGDMADRNFIVVGDVIYSVDENTTHSGAICLEQQLKKKKYLYVKEKFNKLKQKEKEKEKEKFHCDLVDVLEKHF